MTSAASRRRRSSGSESAALCAILLLVVAALGAVARPRPVGAGLPAGETAADTVLHALRAARRDAVRLASATAIARNATARIPVLVVPVDFADARLPDGWDALPELYPPLNGDGLGGGSALRDYFLSASAGRADLHFMIAPLVRLPGTRRDYSDVDLSGASRSRRLATEALTATRDIARVTFRELDSDGPDGVAGSDDDDGDVDGVLILHSDIGDENDPDALIQALQYYLDEPVLDRGTAARSYATASLSSGVGIWAHETAHLLGLEDRYDPFLAVSGGDLAGRGGLGIFSLMAAGAYGSGGGAGAALLDAYSASQLGWCDLLQRRATDGADTLRPVVAGGRVWRLWTHGEAGPEFFLAETRGGAAAAPWDAAVPPGQLLITHVDETLAEGAQSSSDPLTRHLRVALVEADGDGDLRAGLDPGSVSDLFPGSTGTTAWTGSTFPSSSGYDGPTELALTGIVSLAEGVALVVRDASTPGFQLAFGFPAGPSPGLELSAAERGIPVSALAADVVVASEPAWGDFAGADSVRVELVRDAAGVWTPLAAPTWTGEGTAPAGAVTRFRVRLRDGAGFTQTLLREWVWRDRDGALDFGDDWPGEWTLVDRAPEHPGTGWHRWSGEGVPTGDGSALLICTSSSATTPQAWPDVAYANGADLALVSPPLDSLTAAVRLVHAIDGELLRPGVAYDGGVVEFLAGDGSWLPGEPLGGYGGCVAPQSIAGLHGRAAFAGEDSATAEGPALWRLDVVPVPAQAARPVRLALRFAADDRYRGRGWLIARLDPLGGELPEDGFPTAWLPEEESGVSGSGRGTIAWTWPGEEAGRFRVDLSGDGGVTWSEFYRGVPETGAGGYAYAIPYDAETALPLALALKMAPVAPLLREDRLLLRVVAESGLGGIASRPRAFYPGGLLATGHELGLPYPNPGAGPFSLPAITLTPGARLALCDVRGRLVRDWRLPAGEQIVLWDGADRLGRPAAAGVYLVFFAPDPTAAGQTAVVRKVVLVR